MSQTLAALKAPMVNDYFRQMVDRLRPSIDRLTALSETGFRFADEPSVEQVQRACLLIKKLLDHDIETISLTSLDPSLDHETLTAVEGSRIIGNLAWKHRTREMIPKGAQEAMWTEFGAKLHESFIAAVRASIGEGLANIRWDHEHMTPLAFEFVAWQCLWSVFLHEVELTLSFANDRADLVRDFLALLCDGFFVYATDENDTKKLLAFTA